MRRDVLADRLLAGGGEDHSRGRRVLCCHANRLVEVEEGLPLIPLADLVTDDGLLVQDGQLLAVGRELGLFRR